MSGSDKQERAAKDFLAVALDTSDRRQFEGWCREIGPRVGCLKVGLESYVRWGPAVVEAALESGARVFLDLKLHDIPNTVAGAVAAVRSLGVHWLTVHVGGGHAQLKAATEEAGRDLGVLGVTVLTSLGAKDLEALSMPGDPASRAEAWARVAIDAGCAGIVCSAQESGRMRRALGSKPVLVTPGVRPVGAAKGDQVRVATPIAAISAGADLLVVGRPITRAKDAGEAVERILAEIERGLTTRATDSVMIP